MSQQPFGHVEALHVAPTHAPAEHASPGGQAVHDRPPLPHADVLVPVSQRPAASQQPLGHVDALHGVGWQVPALQESPGGQAAHALPPAPQAPVLVPVSQNPRASQHPVGQVEASHRMPTQAPAVQESPGGQGKQAPPPVPQADVLVPDSHLPNASQQPVGHDDELHVAPSHAPETQVSPDGQARHALPPLPQALVLVPGWQVPEGSQQPVGQVVESHGGVLQLPALQMSPDAQVAHASPPVPHAALVVPDSQNPSASQQPFGQVAASQGGPLQAPPVHESPGGHGTQALPPVPHAVALVPDSHFPKASQHPVGQLDALHVVPSQPPPVHVSPDGQTAQARPSVPHAEVLLPERQIPAASQQPAGHVFALHGGDSQVWLAPSQTWPLAAQSSHDSPPVPQARSSCPPTHSRPPDPFGLQQPFGHVEGSQPVGTPRHAWDLGSQDVKPFALQSSQACPSSPHAVMEVPVWQAPIGSQHPVGQVLGSHEPGGTHVRDDELQVSSPLHTVHALPPPPQAAVDVPVTHLPSAVQHPVAHVAALHPLPSPPGPSIDASGPESWPSPVRPHPTEDVNSANANSQPRRLATLNCNFPGDARCIGSIPRLRSQQLGGRPHDGARRESHEPRRALRIVIVCPGAAASISKSSPRCEASADTDTRCGPHLARRAGMRHGMAPATGPSRRRRRPARPEGRERSGGRWSARTTVTA